MKYFICILVFAMMANKLCAQTISNLDGKVALDTSVLGRWPYLNGVQINNNGSYVGYCIENQPHESRTLVIKDLHNKWKREYVGVGTCAFSGDGKQAIFSVRDTLHLLLLGSENEDQILQVSSYQLSCPNKAEWLAYQVNDTDKNITLLNLSTGKERRFYCIKNYMFDNAGSVLILNTEAVGNHKETITWVDLANETIEQIWSGENGAVASDFRFDIQGRQLAFFVKEQNGHNEVGSIWYYKAGIGKSKLLVQDHFKGIDSGLSIDGSPQFSGNGRWVFFQLRTNIYKVDKIASDAVSVNIWSYKDSVLQPYQLGHLNDPPPTFKAVMSVSGGAIRRLEQADEALVLSPNQVTSDFEILVDHISIIESWWNRSPLSSYYLLSLRDGSRKRLQGINSRLLNVSFSPDGNYLIYWDIKLNAYYSYDLKTTKVLNITHNISADFASEFPGGISSLPVGGVAGWVKKDKALLIYDNYDIWQIDPSGSRKPVNITNGYGLRHHVKLRLVYEADAANDIILDSDQKFLLLTGFDVVGKYNGFFRAHLSSKCDPEQLIFGPYTFYRKRSQKPNDYSFDDGMAPICAADGSGWILKRETASDAPNYFYTKDFRELLQLTEVHPEKKYIWLTTELLNWKQFDGSISQGVLYKPENFDPHNQYPIIFNYYEQLSHRMYEFPLPEFTGENINIPWFVSQGYLVFTPDIHYKPANISGKTVGGWAYNSVISAAKYLGSLPYVDNKRMAIQGHSFGGLETCYLVTHSNLFAAAAEVAGSTDPISAYLTLLPSSAGIESGNKQSGIENGHELYGVTPWQRPDLYRKNSAILNANKVTTPILITHNSQDIAVQWRQGVEFYMALRRLGKKVWMLQYDNGSHIVFGKDAVDYTIRLTQFFDYYLKGTLPPIWMTEGVPARLKGIKSGYNLDYTGMKP